MSEPVEKEKIERILIALDASRRSLAALEAAVGLAGLLHAELQGLFVEDIDLLKLAGLPIAREVGYSSRTPRRLNVQAVERLFRSQAAKARSILESEATRAELRWSFHVKRGATTVLTLGASGEADVLIVGHERWTPRRAAVETPLQARPSAEPVVVVYDGTSVGKRALLIGARLAAKLSRPITVLAVSEKKDQAEKLRDEALGWLRDRDLPATAYERPVASGEDLIAAAHHLRARLLLVNRESPFLDETTADVLLNNVDFPVVLVR